MQKLTSQVLVLLVLTCIALLISHYSCVGSQKGGGASPDRSKSHQIKVVQVGNEKMYVVFELKVPFSILQEGRLAICAKPPLVRPIKVRERLFLILASKVIQIDDLNQLRGRVKIETPRAALSFVRLKTSPRTFHAFETRYWELEIVSREQIDMEFVFGDGKLRRVLKNHGQSGLDGIFSSREKIESLGITPAQCQKTRQGYQIRRALVVKDLKRGAVQMLKVVELVGADGRYQRKERRATDLPKTSALFWAMPNFH